MRVGTRIRPSGLVALEQNTAGTANTALGDGALNRNTAGNENTASGTNALYSNTTGTRNTASGQRALFSNTTGHQNTALGRDALYSNSTGLQNIAVGHEAGYNLTTGEYNIAIGNMGVADEWLTTRIGSNQTRAFIAGIRGTTTDAADAVAVVIDSNGQLGTVSSSRRYKQDIAAMGDASARLMQLRPVRFRYRRADADDPAPFEFGLVAEEVADVFPELVIYNENGEPETVKYRLLSSLLLNELQKQEKRLQYQEERLSSMAAQMAELSVLIGGLRRPDEPEATDPSANAGD